MKISISSLSLRFSEMGVGIALIGVPFGMYLNYLLSLNFMSELLMCLSLLLIPSIRKVFSKKINKFDFSFFLIFLMHFIYIGYMLLGEDYTYLEMHVFILIFQLGLFFTDFDKFDINFLIKFIFLISSICTFLGAYYIFNGLVVGDDAWELRQYSDKYYTLEIFTISFGAVINFSTALYFIFNKKNINLIFPILLLVLFLDFYIILYGSKRSPLVCILFVLNLWWFYIFSKINNFKSLVLISPFLIGFILMFFYEKFLDMINDTYLGVLTLMGLGTEEGKTDSASFRVSLRDNAFDIIGNFDLFNIIFGKGYMTAWLDNPLLQSFLDLGVIGFFSYFFVIVLYPVTMYLKNNKNPIIILFFSYCLYALLTSMNSGHGYMSNKYIPVILLCCIIFSLKSKKRVLNS